MRTLVDLPEQQIDALAEIGRRERVSRAALVREAVDELIAKRRRSALDASFGILKGQIEDGLAFQERMRAEWD